MEIMTGEKNDKFKLMGKDKVLPNLIITSSRY